MFRKMRRIKQQMADERVVEVLERNAAGTLALIGDEPYPYAVPISYVYMNGKLYFHSAKTGHKIDAITANEKASFCVIDQNEVVPSEFTTNFRSVIAFGRIRFVEDKDEIRQIMTGLAMKFASDFKDRIPGEIEGAMNRMAIMEMEIDHITGKEAMGLMKKANM